MRFVAGSETMASSVVLYCAFNSCSPLALASSWLGKIFEVLRVIVWGRTSDTLGFVLC